MKTILVILTLVIAGYYIQANGVGTLNFPFTKKMVDTSHIDAEIRYTQMEMDLARQRKSSRGYNSGFQVDPSFYERRLQNLQQRRAEMLR